jgi:hypothetical protein
MFGITRSPARRRWLAVAALCAAGIGLRSVTARAHEVGTTRVSVLFPEGRAYDIEIVTDASALVEKLEASAGRSLPADAGPARLQALLPGLEEIFRRRVKVVFDGAEVRPTIAYAVTPAVDASSAIAATIRLTGEIPKDARLFAWTFAWTFTSYAMTVESAASGTPPIQWLEGDQTSAPFDITSVPRVDRRGTAWRYLTLGVMRIVPHLPAGRPRPFGALAGRRIHRRPFHHARARHVRCRGRAAKDRRALDCALDRVRGARKHLSC